MKRDMDFVREIHSCDGLNWGYGQHGGIRGKTAYEQEPHQQEHQDDHILEHRPGRLGDAGDYLPSVVALHSCSTGVEPESSVGKGRISVHGMSLRRGCALSLS